MSKGYFIAGRPITSSSPTPPPLQHSRRRPRDPILRHDQVARVARVPRLAREPLRARPARQPLQVHAHDVGVDGLARVDHPPDDAVAAPLRVRGERAAPREPEPHAAV